MVCHYWHPCEARDICCYLTVEHQKNNYGGYILLRVADAVALLERSIEKYGLMRTGRTVNVTLNLLRQCDPKLHDVFLIAWYVILHF